MARRHVERKLIDLGGRLRSRRDELRVAEEQLAHLTDLAEDARLRALVSETPVADAEYREAERHAEAMRGHRTRVADDIARMERTQDDLLDRLGGS